MTDLPWGALALSLGATALAVAALMLTTFALGQRRGTHRLVDVAWGLGFTTTAVVACAATVGHGDPLRRTLVVVLTAAWGLRLAAHIARRGRGKGEDPRYERMLSKAPGDPRWYALRMVYGLQGLLVMVVSLPLQLAVVLPQPVGVLDWLGVALWAVGLGFEAVGDRQLSAFKADPAHKGRIMDQGLWRYTRHPNYFGDFTVWWGLYLLACAQLGSAALALVSPLVMSGLLVFGSGKRLLERQMSQRPGYAEYAARTSGFFPLPPRKTDTNSPSGGVS
ncbi:DUF1295 domain-containing protein [Streptomyces sp. NPDC005438]|uniref:DUF1295 domain-containing protein n=1 Tax=Streptomyces sp. NPDC005438 TaxID=3156880 RepID=UPI0033AA2865